MRPWHPNVLTSGWTRMGKGRRLANAFLGAQFPSRTPFRASGATYAHYMVVKMPKVTLKTLDLPIMALGT